MGYSRDRYYCFRELYATEGEEALKVMSLKKPIPANRIEPYIEKEVVDLNIAEPE